MNIIDGFVHELRATVRDCIDCGALVAGGPTRCVRCAEMSALPAWKRRILWWFRIYTPKTTKKPSRVLVVGNPCARDRMAGLFKFPPGHPYGPHTDPKNRRGGDHADS